VFVVDDDARVRDALSELIVSYDFEVMCFGSAQEYVVSDKPDVPACLILDVNLPDINGIELQRRLAASDQHQPIVFISGCADIPSSVRAMKAGAVDFLTKPFPCEELLQAVRTGIERDREARARRARLAELQQRFSCLTPREREVLPLVISGFLNKQAAVQLGISEITLQIHRRKVMHKMAATSLADLVRMAGALNIPVIGGRA
jgi:FixJ family two-component response regulator